MYMYLSNIESDSIYYSDITNPPNNRGPQAARFIPLLSMTRFNVLTPKCRETSLMAEMRKVEGSAFPETCKLNQPNSINKTLEDMKEVKEEDPSDSKKRLKLEIPAENVKNIITVAEKIVESKNGEEGYKGDENDNKDVHLKVESETVDKGKRKVESEIVDKGKRKVEPEIVDKGKRKVEPEIVDKGKRIAAVDKGKAILIQEFEERGEKEEDIDDNDDEEDYDYDSSDDSDSDFSDGLGGDSEVDLAN